MLALAVNHLQQELVDLPISEPDYASRFVDALLSAAQTTGASDVHIQPIAASTSERLMEVRWRIDGVLQPVGVFAAGAVTDVVTRLKVMAELLTYKTEVPQEGRISPSGSQVEMRVSTFPTLHGERAVVRLFAKAEHFQYVADIGFSTEISDPIHRLLGETSGAFLITGPAGSGKTTTAYACLRDLVRDPQQLKSIVSLEDPIEVAIDGVAQSQVNHAVDFTLDSGLRSLLRQDPEVVMVGEIRDPSTAALALQAALTGHLIISSFHAGSSMAAISRLADMGIPNYLLRSCILGIVGQRLVRRLCPECKQEIVDRDQLLGLEVSRGYFSPGCPACLHTGYQGRAVIGELFEVRTRPKFVELLRKEDARTLSHEAKKMGLRTLLEDACGLVEQGVTSPAEVRRVFGVEVRD